MNRLALVAAATLALTGCHDFRDDLMIICDSVDKIQVPPDAKSAAKLAAAGEYMWEHTKTKDGKALITYLSGLNRTERGKVLRNLSAQYGLAACHLADLH